MSDVTTIDTRGKRRSGDTPELDGATAPRTVEERDLQPHQSEMLKLYRRAREAQGAIEVEDPAWLGGELVGTVRLNSSFLLPNGEKLGKEVSIGLQEYPSNRQLHEIRYSAEDGGFWLRFSGESAGTIKETWVLVLDGASGKDAIKTFTPSQKVQLELYRAARKAHGAIEIGDPAWLGGELVGAGGLNESFLLPNGKKLGKQVRLGLPHKCNNPQLHEIRYSAEGGGFWLRFSGESAGKTKETKETWVLVLDEVSGKDAIKTFGRYNYLEPHQKELFDLYREGKKTGLSLPFKNPNAARGDLVNTSSGRLQKSFLLPNGKPLQDWASIGLPNKCTNPQFHDLRYSAEDQGFWIKVSAQKGGRTTVIEFLVSDDPNVEGKAAILKFRKLGLPAKKKHELPPEFRRDRDKGELHAVKRKGNHGDADTEVRSKGVTNSVTFVKGEAFEQLIGIALALKYPGEEIVPQFCLMVGLNSEGDGYYGMRADFRVGKDKIIEVKWGRATSNIIETYTRHTEQLDKNGNPQPSYEVIMLEENLELSNLGVPHTLFSKFVEGLNPEARMLISKTQELIARLVNTGDRPQLERIRDFLYGALAELRDGGQGAQRTENLKDALTFLLLQEDKDLRGYLEENTTIYFNPLEANFEWKGKLHSDCIDPTQYYLEHPESYELTYLFDAARTGSSQGSTHRLRFADKLARDLAVAQEIICGATQEFPADGEVIRDPVFKFSPAISVIMQGSSAKVVTPTGAVAITELAQLREVLRSTVLNTADEAFGDMLGFAEAWVKCFPVRA